MANIKELALAFEPQQTKNISELKHISIDVEVTEEKHIKKETGEEFTIKVIEVEGEKYRVPNSVLENIKVLLEKFPNMKHFTVLKSGNGMATRYQVLPIEKESKEEVPVEVIEGA